MLCWMLSTLHYTAAPVCSSSNLSKQCTPITAKQHNLIGSIQGLPNLLLSGTFSDSLLRLMGGSWSNQRIEV